MLRLALFHNINRSREHIRTCISWRRRRRGKEQILQTVIIVHFNFFKFLRRDKKERRYLISQYGNSVRELINLLPFLFIESLRVFFFSMNIFEFSFQIITYHSDDEKVTNK